MKVNHFAKNLKYLREKSGMSMEELSKHINVSKQSISKYEKGLIEPNFHTLVSISSIFNCSLDDLVFKDNFETCKNSIDLSNYMNTKFDNLNKDIDIKINDTKKDIIKYLIDYLDKI
ncbi:helix-turn-helix domain-containing protein (plasmid) [Paraclostridium tenue]